MLDNIREQSNKVFSLPPAGIFDQYIEIVPYYGFSSPPSWEVFFTKVEKKNVDGTLKMGGR